MMKDKQYYEIVLDSFGLSFLVTAVRMPTVEEATEFWKDDIRLVSGSDDAKIQYIREVDYEEAISSFDMEGSDKWPVFGAENEQATVGLKKEKLFKRCPKCNYNRFASDVVIHQKALINGEGEYSEEYESELTNPVVSDSTVWECIRCGHKAPGSEFTVSESKLRDTELEDVFSIYPDLEGENTNLFYKGNELIGEADKDATAKEIRDEIASNGYYVVDDEIGREAKVYPLRYLAEITVSNKTHSLNATISNLKNPEELMWMSLVEALYCSSADFKENDELDCRIKITACDGVVYGGHAKTIIARNGELDY